MATRFSVEAIFKAIDKVTAPTNKMNRVVKRFTVSMIRGLKKVGSAAKRMGKSMLKAGKKLLQFSAVAAAAALVALTKGFKDFVKAGDEVAKTSRQIGLGAEALQELRFAADRQGVSSSVLTKSLQLLNRNVGDVMAGQGTLTTMLKRTNPNLLKQLKGVKNNSEAFNIFIKEINKLPTQMQKAALAQAAFGRGGQEILKLAEAGPKGIKNLREEARKYGLITNIAAKQSEGFIDEMTNLLAVVKGVGNTLFSKFIAPLTKGIKNIKDWVLANKELIGQGIDKFLKIVGIVLQTVFNIFTKFMNKVGKPIAKIFAKITKNGKGLGDIFKFIVGVADALIEGLAFVINLLAPFAPLIFGIVAAFTAFNIVLNLNPIVAIITAALIIIGLLIKNWDVIKAAFIKGLKIVGKFFQDTWDNIKKSGAAVWEGLKAGFQAAMDGIKKILFTIASVFLDIFGGIVKGVLGAVAAVGKSLGFNVEGLKGVIKNIENLQKDIKEKAGIKVETEGGIKKDSFLGTTIGVTENIQRQVAELLIKDETGKASLKTKGEAPNINLKLQPSGGL